jgi:hypothetical protein
MDNVGILNGQLEYFMAIRHILGPIGIFFGHVVYSVAIWYMFFCVLVCCAKKTLLRAILLECRYVLIRPQWPLDRCMYTT